MNQDNGQIRPRLNRDLVLERMQEIRAAIVLQREAGLPVEVRAIDTAPASFRYAVTRGEELCIRDAEAFAAFRERTWNEYFDFAPLREEALRDLARAVRRA